MALRKSARKWSSVAIGLALIPAATLLEGRLLAQSNPVPFSAVKEPVATSSKGTEATRDLLRKARMSLQAGDFTNAEKFARQAQSSGAPLPFWEVDTPERMLADITNARAKAAPNADPKVLLKQSRESLAAGRFDEAQALASRANAASARWGVFEDNPTKCLEDLQKARTKAERAEAIRLMADARKCMTEGKLDEAEGMAYRAERLHGAFSVLDGAERPQKLLGEIQSARGKARKNNSGVVQAAGTEAPAPNWTTDMNASSKSEILRVSGSAVADASAHEQAKLLMAEGKSAMRWGRLAEARTKFIEAQNLKADFKPDEENPIRCLNDLMNLVNRQLREAVAINCSATDATAAKEACAERLMHAKQLAMD